MIDVKKKQTIKQSETAVAGFLEDLSYWSAAEAITQLIRAVIADEAAKLDGKTICTYPVVPEGDVPEWFVHAIYEGTTIEVDHAKAKAIAWRAWTHGKARDSLEAEVALRVAEQTQRIIDSYGMTAKCFEESRDKWKALANNRLADCANKDKRIAELEATNKSLLDGRREIRQELVEAKRQLAAAQAEVERVRKFGDSMEDELTRLRQQLAEATKPTGRQWFGVFVGSDKSEADTLAKRNDGTNLVAAFVWSDDADAWKAERFPNRSTVARVDGPPDSQRERAARVAAEKDYDELDQKHSENLGLLDQAVQLRKDAEAERDELREAWKRMRVLMNCGSKDKFYRVRIDEECLTDDDIESLLVAFREFRAEKAKVQA
jgi:hypothetical protein